MVTIRSPSGMNWLNTFSSVVLPEPVPPETSMFCDARTASSRNSAISLVMLPKRIRSSTVSFFLANFRIVTEGPSSASGGITALTREPSGRRASTIGLASSMCRPSGSTIRWMIESRCRLLKKRAPVS